MASAMAAVVIRRPPSRVPAMTERRQRLTGSREQPDHGRAAGDRVSSSAPTPSSKESDSRTPVAARVADRRCRTKSGLPPEPTWMAAIRSPAGRPPSHGRHQALQGVRIERRQLDPLGGRVRLQGGRERPEVVRRDSSSGR